MKKPSASFFKRSFRIPLNGMKHRTCTASVLTGDHVRLPDPFILLFSGTISAAALLKPKVLPPPRPFSASNLASYFTKKRSQERLLRAPASTSVHLFASVSLFLVFLPRVLDELFLHLSEATASSWAPDTLPALSPALGHSFSNSPL